MTELSHPTILVVEDQNALRRVMVRMLTGNGFRVLQAANATQGLAVFQDHHSAIDLAIIDMIMPGMSGLDLAAEMERRHPGTKILYTSGYGSSVAMESISRRSPEHVLPKPFTGGQLVERVARLLGAQSPPATLGSDSIGRLLESGFAWERLVEASEELTEGAAELVGYRDTGAAFAVAAVHAAALRAAEVAYEFRPTEDEQYPFSLFVPRETVTAARRLVGCVGLGVDIATAA